MARGMWTGIAAGFAKAQERKLLEQERQDKLGLAAQAREDMLAGRAQEREMFDLTRADRYVDRTIENLDRFAKAGVTINSNAKGAGSMSENLKVLKIMGYDDETITDLAVQGNAALTEAIKITKDNANPEIPYKPSDFKFIASTIIANQGSTPTEEQAKTYLETNLGVDFNKLDSQQSAYLLQQARQELTKASSATSGFTTRTVPPKNQDIKVSRELFMEGINGLLGTKAAQVDRNTAEGLERVGQIETARDKLKAGDPVAAIDILRENNGSEFIKFYQQYLDNEPRLYGPDANVDIGLAVPFKQLYGSLTESTQTPQVTRVTTRINPETGDLEVVQ